MIQFGQDVLVRVGFPLPQALATAKILVEADLRGDFAHGLTGSSGLSDMVGKVSDDQRLLGFMRIEASEYVVDQGRYPTIINVDAKGGLGQYAALEILPQIISKAQKYGYAKAYIRNSNHFGDCGIYTEMIAEHDLAAKITCTSPAWSKPFIELQKNEDPYSFVNLHRYDNVKKRFGTNPIAWSIPYAGGIITLDIAMTQRAASPALAVAKHNAKVLEVFPDENGVPCIEINGETKKLSEVHLAVATSQTKQEALNKLGRNQDLNLKAAEKGLMKGPGDVDIIFPLAFDEFVQKECYIAPLGGTYYGYKGFGLNMLIELDNVIGGGEPGLLRILSQNGTPLTTERVSQTIEAYALDFCYPLAEAKNRLRESVDTTLNCGNRLLYLPGQKEQENKRKSLAQGIPMTLDRITALKKVAGHPNVALDFDLSPIRTD